jgi:hypothetical protein
MRRGERLKAKAERLMEAERLKAKAESLAAVEISAPCLNYSQFTIHYSPICS